MMLVCGGEAQTCPPLGRADLGRSVVYFFAVTSLSILLATIVNSMLQFALLSILSDAKDGFVEINPNQPCFCVTVRREPTTSG